MSWCLQDPALVVSSAKDQRTIVTNFQTGEVVLEFPGRQAYEQIKWSPHLPGKIAAFSEHGHTEILSFSPVAPENDDALDSGSSSADQFALPIVSPQTGSAYAPKWLHKKCGARFGFGGKLAFFNG